jgi:hypothetical protein
VTHTGGLPAPNSIAYNVQVPGQTRTIMEQHEESQDAAIAQALAEEITLATASNIELARRLAERPAIFYQEIVVEQGERNICTNLGTAGEH